MKVGTKIVITMGRYKGDGVVIPKKGSGASPAELHIKLTNDRKIVIHKDWVRSASK